jgi:subtilisin family serine protease
LLGVVLAVGVHAYLPGGSREPSGGASSVTLITGDRVHLQWRASGGVQATIVPASGREAISFAQLSSTNASGQEDLSIVPSDAQPLLANGLLDPALFNVTELVRQGLATPDDGAGGLPLIVTFAATRASIAPLMLTAAVGVQQSHELPSIGGVAVADGKGAVGAFWKWLTGDGGPERTAAIAAGTASSPGLEAGVAKVWLDARARTMLDQSGPQIGVPRARALGLTGTGVTVAVLDSGIKADHPDLAGRIAEARDFTNTSPDASDNVGHGTHVAGIIGGTGAASAGRYEGVAPGVTLINGKVCVPAGCPLSAIIAGMEWAAPRARVINMSLGGPPSDGTDPVSQSLDNLTMQHGTLFIVAAGNAGRPLSVSSPASAREAVAVGSVTKQDTLSVFSSQGPRVGDFAIKPDLAAPGSSIVSARVPGTEVGEVDPVDDNYVRVSGTSMATPQVAGAAALLLQQHPDWTGAQLRAALTSSTATIADATVFEQGAGRLDVGRAVTQSVFASGTASFGLIPWPHDRPATHTVTYANYGSESVTLDLALAVTDGQGSPAPDGMFTVDAGTVTVPAQGTADAQVTLTPASRTIGTFSGRLIATSGTTRVVTAVAAVQEAESFNLTLTGIGRGPSFFGGGWVINLETGNPLRFDVGTGRETITLRLPKGRYEVDASISTNDPVERSTALVSEPEVTLDADRSVTLDATRARRVSAQVDASGTVIDGQALLVTTEIAGSRFFTVSFLFTSVSVPYAVPTRRVTGRFYEFVYEPVLGVPVPGVTPRRFSPIYTLELSTKGRIPEELGFVVRDRDLARVRAAYHAQGVLAGGRRFDFAFTPQRTGASRISSQGLQPLPSERFEFYTPGREFLWSHSMIISEAVQLPMVDEGETVRDQTYRAGHHEHAWNRAPLGPAFSTIGPLNAREASTIVVRVPPFSSNEDGHYTQTPITQGVSGTTRLARDGVTLGESATLCAGRFAVPDSPGRYTLTCTANRVVPFSVLGTRSEATWTFTAPGPTPPTAPAPLPLLAVRATGAVFGMNDAPAGRLFPLVLHVERPVGAPSTRIASLELDASFDDGATWKQAVVLRIPGDDRGLAILRHPRSAGFVSLRLRAADANGNRVTHTMIRAYGITVVP